MIPLNTVKKGGFASQICLKIANMVKPQEFCIYPYNGGDTIYLQSDKRWIEANLRTGKAYIIKKGMDYANSSKMAFFGHIETELPAEALTNLQAHLWNNAGVQGNSCVSYENKELFSTTI